MIARGGRVVPLLDALWAVRNRKKLPGITDLRPRRNGGAFLRWLEEREAKQARRAGGRALPVLAIGGNTQGGGFAYWMSKRFLAGLPNDLVVPTISSTPSTFRPTLEAACDHFSYFQPPEQPRLDAAADFIKEHLGLEEAQHGLPPNGPSRKGRGTPPQASV
jgi:hypothetical protein